MSFRNGLHTIVVATDLKGQSEAALEYARKLAGAYGARIVLAYGEDPVDYAAVDEIPGRVRKELSSKARAYLDELATELLREGIHSHTEIAQGEVAQMLVDVARQYQAGLIVLGTRGNEGAGPVVIGTIAEHLVRLAPCPVLAVAADWNAGPFRPTPGGPILLAIERNEAAPAAVATAYSLAEMFDRPLLALHARTAAETVGFLNPPATTAEQFGIPNDGQVQVKVLVKDGAPADVVAQTIAQHHPSILVVGVKRSSGTHGPHGTAFALLACSRVPVLCVPPEIASTITVQEWPVSVAAG